MWLLESKVLPQRLKGLWSCKQNDGSEYHASVEESKGRNRESPYTARQPLDVTPFPGNRSKISAQI